MATTTAAITLTSSDLLTNALALSSTSTCYKAGTTTGLDGIQYEKLEIASGTQYDIVDATAAGANKANKVYVINKHTDVTKYIEVYIAALQIGRLYAGDWMFIPLEAAPAGTSPETYLQDVSLKAISTAQVVEFALIHEGKTLATS